jgi:hypothetical protein
VHATAVTIEPAPSVPSEKNLQALWSQVEFVPGPPVVLEPPPKWGGAGPKRPSDLRRARPSD